MVSSSSVLMHIKHDFTQAFRAHVPVVICELSGFIIDICVMGNRWGLSFWLITRL